MNKAITTTSLLLLVLLLLQIIIIIIIIIIINNNNKNNNKNNYNINIIIINYYYSCNSCTLSVAHNYTGTHILARTNTHTHTHIYVYIPSLRTGLLNNAVLVLARYSIGDTLSVLPKVSPILLMRSSEINVSTFHFSFSFS